MESFLESDSSPRPEEGLIAVGSRADSRALGAVNGVDDAEVRETDTPERETCESFASGRPLP